jgi:hypothetical protein
LYADERGHARGARRHAGSCGGQGAPDVMYRVDVRGRAPASHGERAAVRGAMPSSAPAATTTEVTCSAISRARRGRSMRR